MIKLLRNIFLTLLALGCIVIGIVFSAIWFELVADKLLLKILG